MMLFRKWTLTWLLLCFATSFSAAQVADKKPLFSFGVIADVQYADADQWGKRDYRGSPKRLEECLEIFNAHQLAFIVHAGDLIDRYYESFDLPLAIFRRAAAPIHYVIGNHEFSVADSLKKGVRRLLNNPRGYYAFVNSNVQFILLDALDVSPHSAVKGTKQYEKALTMLKGLEAAKANNAYEWNGALGKRQLRWLRRRLREAGKEGYKTVLFSHLPLLPENGLQLWNNREVLNLLKEHASVVAFISGHHHEGGYVKDGSIHHLTLKGVVESQSEGACGIVDVYPDGLHVNGYGDQPDYILAY